MTLATKLIISASIFSVAGMAFIGWLNITSPSVGISSNELISHQKQFENSYRDLFGTAPNYLKPIEYDLDTNYYLYTAEKVGKELPEITARFAKAGWNVHQDDVLTAGNRSTMLKVADLGHGRFLIASESDHQTNRKRFRFSFLEQLAKLRTP